MNQTQHAPFAEQKKKPTTEHIMVCQERNNTYIIYGMKMERAGKKQLQYARIIKKIGKNQNNKKVQKEKIYNKSQNNTTGKSDELTQTHREKAKQNINDKKERTQKTELKKE